jgi:type II secretory pathway predicted ATPase ExeA/septal ring-binding cell division protein DamX
VLEALIYAITRGEGIVKVTGEVGSGKTMLCSMLQNRLPENVDSVYLANPSVAPEDVLHAIAFELQLGVDRKADRLEVMHALQDYLVKRHAEGRRVVVFIEESQSMPLPTLEEIRLLSNLETRNDKLLQIVLFGQPELDENLRRPDIRQLRDRIAHSFRLQPLTDDEVREYLMFRMRAAGYKGPEIFASGTVKQIAKASSGLTRRINLIADKALLAAFAENTHTIQPAHVRAALNDSEFGRSREPWRVSPAFGWAALTLVLGAGLGAGLYALLGDRPDDSGFAPGSPHTAAAKRSTAAVGQAGTPMRIESGAGVVAPAAAAQVASAAAPVSVAALQTKAGPASAAAQPATVALATPSAAQQAPASAAAPRIPAARRADAPAQPAALNATQEAIAARIEATQNWINSDLGGAFSIQLLVADDLEQLRNHLKALPKFIEINDIYMYRIAARGRPMFNLFWGSFADRRDAQEELAELPASLRANRPYVRTLSGIRAEFDRHHDVARR